ncbi:MAG: DUF4115 domain-containing protein [Elusimicrobia bacterium]|nr:DUF4115 domain-containing protein [Elusimicrobiota bacterium]
MTPEQIKIPDSLMEKTPARPAESPSVKETPPADAQADIPIHELFKKRRQERGLTLEKVREDTKITVKFIAALEEGRYNVFPAKIYCRGFFLSYAKYLGIPDPFDLWEKIEDRVPLRSGQHVEETRETKRAAQNRNLRDDAARDLSWGEQFVLWVTEGQNWIIVFIVFPAVFLGGFYGIYSYIQHRSFQDSPEKALNIPRLLGQEAARNEQRAPSATPAAASLNAPAAPVKEFVLEISAKSEPTWLRAETDGRLTFQGILPAIQKRTFRGRGSIKLRIGNPKSIEARANGALWSFTPEELEKTPLEVEFTPGAIETALGVKKE